MRYAEHSLAEKSELKGYVSQVSQVSASRDNRFSSIIIISQVSCVQIYHYPTRNSSLLYLLFLQEFPRVLMRCIQVSRNFTHHYFPGLEFPITPVSLMFGWDWNSGHTRLEKLITPKARASHQSHSGFDEVLEWVYFTESTYTLRSLSGPREPSPSPALWSEAWLLILVLLA